MDITKLLDKVMTNEELRSVPLIYILMVFNGVIEAINSGECFYTNE